MRSRTGEITRRKRSLRPATMPSGMPMARARTTAASIRSSVETVESHSPSRPNAMKLATTNSAVRQLTKTSASAPNVAVSPIQLNP